MIHPRRLLVLVPLALSLAGCGQTSAPATTTTSSSTTPDTPSLPFEKYALANGLEVILSEDHRLPLVAVDLWYHVGPANEAAGRTGFAHLFEHMMFQGSKHVPGDSHFKLLEAAGGTNLNGTTDFDRTNYFETLPSNQLELGLWLESDRMGYLLDELDQAKLSNQQDVVRNERRQSVENEPYGIVDEAVYHEPVSEGPSVLRGRDRIARRHPGGEARRREGVLQAVLHAQQREPRDRRRRRQGAGQDARREVLRHAQARAGRAEGHGADAADHERAQASSSRTTCSCRACTWRGSRRRIFTPGDADADIAAGILGGGHSSRLYKALVYDKQIAQDVSAAQQSLSLSSVFRISRPRVRGTRPTSSRRPSTSSSSALSASGPDAKEVERARNVFETNLLSGLAGPRRIWRRGRHAQPLQPLREESGLPGRRSRAASRGDGGERQDVRCRPRSSPTRASWSSACRAIPTWGRRCRRRPRQRSRRAPARKP